MIRPSEKVGRNRELLRMWLSGEYALRQLAERFSIARCTVVSIIQHHYGKGKPQYSNLEDERGLMTESNSTGRQVGGTHYKDLEEDGKQHWDIMWELYGEAWFVGNITKYVYRYKLREGLKDLGKAMHYADKLVELARRDYDLTVTSNSGKYTGFCVVRDMLHALITREKDTADGNSWAHNKRDYRGEILELLLTTEVKVGEPIKTVEQMMNVEDGTFPSEKSAPLPPEKSFRQIQEEIGKWAYKQFGENSSKDVNSVSHGHPLGSIPALLGMGEELGELNRVVLRKHQGRGLKWEQAQEAKADALADLLVYMCDFATRDEIDLQSVLNAVWQKVQKRTQQNWEADKARENLGEKINKDSRG